MNKALARLAFLGVLCAVNASAFATGGFEIVDPSTQGVSAPYLIPSSRVAPVYPPAALQARLDAMVLLRATVLADGSVGDVEVVDSTRGKLGFEKAATRAVQQWKFEPAQLDGQEVASYAWVRARFNPPQSGAGGSGGGFVAVDFPRDIAKSLGNTGIGTAVSMGQLNAPDLKNRSAASDSRDRFNTMLKIPCQTVGCVYSRSALFPPASYDGQNISPQR